MLLNTLDLFDDRVGLGSGTPITSEGYAEATRMPRVMSQNSDTATVEPTLDSSTRFVALARGFNISTFNIGLVQTVGIVHERAKLNEEDVGARRKGGMTFVGACDETRQYQGESECLAQGI